MKLNKSATVYVIHNTEFNITKIGFSSNPGTRISNLITACGCDLKLCYNTLLITNAEAIERMAHKQFKEYHKKGEWFNISPDTAIQYLKSIEDKYVFDNIIKLYKEGKNVTDLSKTYGVTRQAIIRRLHKTEFRIEVIENVIKEPVLIEVKNISSYKRIAPGLYNDINGKTYKIQYNKGKFYKLMV